MERKDCFKNNFTRLIITLILFSLLARSFFLLNLIQLGKTITKQENKKNNKQTFWNKKDIFLAKIPHANKIKCQLYTYSKEKLNECNSIQFYIIAIA